MNNKTIFKKQLIPLTILTILIATSFLMTFPTNISNSPNNEQNQSNSIKEENLMNVENDLKSSIIGEDSWWNASFKYRQLINITNPYSYALDNYIVSITFNYTTLVSDKKMNSSLKDVRIVENDEIKNYFVQKDYPNNTLATVWFETNLASGPNIEQDTYLYYGNNSVNRASAFYNKDNRFGIAWWRFDEGFGTIADDSIGNIGDGTLGNMEGTDWFAGKVGNHSLNFDGWREYVRIPNNVNPQSAITVSAWIKSARNNVYNNSYQIVSKYNAFALGSTGTNDVMAFRIYNNTSWQTPTSFDLSTQGMYPENWHLFIATYDSSTGQEILYVDGILRDTYTIGTTSHPTINYDSGPIDIGHREGTALTNLASYFNGSIDDVRIFNYAISSDDIKGLYNYTTVGTKLNEEQKQFSEILITVYDVDGRIVHNAEVSLFNASTNEFIIAQNTSNAGTVSFINFIQGQYNITVNFTLHTSELVVYNSSKTNEIYDVTSTLFTADVFTNLTTIDFEIVDWDKFPLYLGYINISESPTSKVLDTIILDSYGTASFCWTNRSAYYYRIYYNNEDYETKYVLLHEGWTDRTQYTQNEKYLQDIIYVNQSNIYGGGLYYQINEAIYTNKSTQLNNKKLLEANLTLSNMQDTLLELKIYYIDKDGAFAQNLIYEKMYTFQTSDFINLDISKISNDHLEQDNFEVYGLQIYLKGANTTICNGTIKIDTREAMNVYNITSLAKLNIKVLDVAEVNPNPIAGVVIRIKDGVSGVSIVNLTTNIDGYAYGTINSNTEFWYSRNIRYNFTLFFFQPRSFFVNVTNQYKPESQIAEYNYTLYTNYMLVFKIPIDITAYQSNFTNLVGNGQTVIWGQDLTFSVNYTVTENGNDASPVWRGLEDPDSIVCNFGNLKVKTMNGLGNGIFTITFNSNNFSASGSSKTYIVSIYGNKLGYIDPDPVYFLITINAIPTSTSFHSWNDPTQILTGYSQNYNELINITVSYYPTGISSNKLGEARLNYSWDYGSGSNIGEDPIHPGYYTFEVNTSSVPSVATYGIDVSISKENYTTKNFVAYLDILPRTTRLNGTTTLLHNSTTIWINDTYTWIYKYVDTDTGNIVGNLETVYYYWYEIDEEGKPVGKTSANINLENGTGNTYVLDFNTKNREVGSYALFVTFQKNNYEARNAFIDLTIKYREFRASLTATGKDGLIITRVKGQPIVFSLTLTDLTRSSSASSGGAVSTQAAVRLTKATVKLSIAGLGKIYKFTEVASGVYNLTIDTTDPAYQAFFAPQTLAANITIEKQNYVTQVIDITIVVDMDQWIPGFPAFYLLMIIIGVGAVVGSLVTYRYIQLAKIPRFVKTARAMKKSIKLSEPISESLTYPSKKEYMAKILGEKFDVLGVSLHDILGIERKKMEIIPEIKKGYKESLEKKLKSYVKKEEKKPESKEDINDNNGGAA